jgi:hypothetical protein
MDTHRQFGKTLFGWAALVSLSLLAFAGCNIQKEFVTNAPGIGSENPLAVGQQWTVRVEQQRGQFPDRRTIRCEQIDSATSEDPDIVRVVQKSSCRVRIEARSAGVTRINFDIDGNEGSFRVRASALDRVRSGHTCTESNEAAYFSDSRATLEYRMLDSRGQTMYGDVLPLSFVPMSRLEVMDDENELEPISGYFEVEFANEEGKIDVTPDAQGNILAINLVRPQAIADVNTDFSGLGGTGLTIGDTGSLLIQPLAGGNPICQWSDSDVELKVSTSTSARCDVYLAPGAPDESEWVVRGKSEGTCQIVVEFPEGDGLEGVTHTTEIPVVDG